MISKQLNTTRSCIKNILSKITEKFKEFKFQQNLRAEFTKKVFKNKIFADRWFDSGKIEFNDIDVEKRLNI